MSQQICLFAPIPPPTARISGRLGKPALTKGKGQVLLRRVANDFAGYRWSWAKGTPDPGESPEQTALREVLEETGYQAEIICQLPGTFVGGLTENTMFLMRPVGEPWPFCCETSEVRWVNPVEAPALINQTTHKTGRDRDLAMLESIVKNMIFAFPLKNRAQGLY